MIFPSRPRFVGLVLAAALLAPVGAACSDDDGEVSDVTVGADDPTTTSTDQPTTTTADPDAEIEAAVEQAFRRKWDAYVQLGAAPTTTSPLIDEVFTGTAREDVLDAMSQLVAEGNAVRLPGEAARFRPMVNSIELLSDDEAIVFECTLDGLVVFNTASGQIVNDAVNQVAGRNLLRLVDGVWKIAEIDDVRQGDPQCDF